MRASSIGFSAKSVTGVEVQSGVAVEQNITLETEAIQVGALEVTASAERGSVNRALDQQRTATAIVNSVTADVLSARLHITTQRRSGATSTQSASTPQLRSSASIAER